MLSLEMLKRILTWGISEQPHLLKTAVFYHCDRVSSADQPGLVD